MIEERQVSNPDRFTESQLVRYYPKCLEWQCPFVCVNMVLYQQKTLSSQLILKYLYINLNSPFVALSSLASCMNSPIEYRISAPSDDKPNCVT